MFLNRITKLIITFFVATTFVGLSTKALANFEGNWEGNLNVSGQRVPLVLHIDNKDGKWVGSIDSPAQAEYGIPMSSIKVNNDKLIFELASMSIHYEGIYDKTTDNISGTFIQGAPFKLKFKRGAKKNIGHNLAQMIGTWSGDLKFNGQSIPFVIHVEKKAGEFRVTHDSPAQGGFGIPVDHAKLNGDEFIFGITSLNSSYKGKLDASNNRLKGHFSQRGYSLPLDLAKKN